jgi:hypothetical protein
MLPAERRFLRGGCREKSDAERREKREERCKKTRSAWSI